ncbi:hypothetical protein J6590_056151 [Homalodisca vitripennis]|nr:hypothetical protein J6590_056151 [Homalodisca vitripennis]
MDFCLDEQGGTNPQQDTSTHQEEIEISPWIAENLIIMEVFNERSWIDCPKEVIFQSVRSCPALEEIIIEKKRDPISKLIGCCGYRKISESTNTWGCSLDWWPLSDPTEVHYTYKIKICKAVRQDELSVSLMCPIAKTYKIN